MTNFTENINVDESLNYLGKMDTWTILSALLICLISAIIFFLWNEYRLNKLEVKDNDDTVAFMDTVKEIDANNNINNINNENTNKDNFNPLVCHPSVTAAPQPPPTGLLDGLLHPVIMARISEKNSKKYLVCKMRPWCVNDLKCPKTVTPPPIWGGKGSMVDSNDTLTQSDSDEWDLTKFEPLGRNGIREAALKRKQQRMQIELKMDRDRLHQQV
eukprot:GHVR01000607.1.p1 GENE.GHVR01000607.1~~GHVR01000607.1.p1  ORF type:complete len:215 (-),score=65.16 GHVR01000607.1:697-1341(-)